MIKAIFELGHSRHRSYRQYEKFLVRTSDSPMGYWEMDYLAPYSGNYVKVLCIPVNLQC